MVCGAVWKEGVSLREKLYAYAHGQIICFNIIYSLAALYIWVKNGYCVFFIHKKTNSFTFYLRVSLFQES